jgi:ArsR family transcriptional regulator
MTSTFDLELFFQALANQTRLRLLNLMADKEICVCYLAEILDQLQPKISRHLAYLRKAGIVASRRNGKWMHYRIATPSHAGAAIILQQTLASLKDERIMQSDRKRLTVACCSPATFTGLLGAPIPVATTCCERS